MHNVYDCVDSFVSLLDTKYDLILGRKGVAVSLQITFDKKDCFHLMGLQYLKDRPELNRDRGKIFDELRERKLTKEKIESSDFYNKIAARVDMLPYLENLIDSNETIFKYNQKINNFSLIMADYLMRNKVLNQNIFIFLAKSAENTYFCRSFFTEDKRDYSKNQASWTLLYKKKTRISTNEEDILYDKKHK